MARPLKLNETIKDALIKCIRAGLSYKRAADFCGISEQSFIDYRRQGQRDSEAERKSICSELFEGIKKAEAEAILLRLKNIQDASKEHWQASAWFLERKYPDEWGKKDRHALEGTLQLETILSGLPRSFADAVRRALEASIAEEGD